MGIPTDVAGWGPTRWGMSVQEMEQALTGTNVRKTDRSDYTTHYVDFIIDSADIGPFTFEVNLHQSKETHLLDRVVLRHKAGVDESTNRQVAAAFNALVAQYGSPTKLDRSDSYRWTFPSTVIELNMFSIADMFKVVAISFMKELP